VIDSDHVDVIDSPPRTLPAAVLWDMDGTLVDTEPYWIECEQLLVQAFGGTWTDEDARSIIGADLLDAAAVLRDRGGVDLPPREIVERLLDGVTARVRERVPWRPGARRLLAELNARAVPCALVTMSWKRFAQAVVEALPEGSFQAAVTGDSVARGKPHPEPYLAAARKLGVDAAECLAIEDSPAGVASAEAAGCTVLAVPNLVAIDPGGRRVFVRSLRDVDVDDLGPLVAEPPLVDDPRPPPDAGAGARRRFVVGDRRRIWAAAGAVAAVLVGVSGYAAWSGDEDGERPAHRPGALNVQAWMPYWALDDALPELEERADVFHELSPFWYEATGVDRIDVMPNTPSAEAEEFIDQARDEGIPLVASILDATEPGTMASILADEGTRARHVDAIAAFAADHEFAGIDIDYERFAFADGRDTWARTQPNWVAFVTELAARLHADGRTLVVSIPPVYDAGQTADSGYWVYDYASITPVVDAIRIMAYDYSNASSDPGPVAPLEWVKRIIAGTSAASGDPSKLVLGIPLYGYNWPTSVAGECPASEPAEVTTVTNRSVDDLLARRGGTPVYDPVTGEWSFTYELVAEDGATSCTQQRQVNYVDADGAQARMQLAVEAGFGGVSLFAFGYDDPAVWGAVDTVEASITPTSAAAEVTAP
jgi:HAD superfamily hydrolase (TIGR01509 family)